MSAPGREPRALYGRTARPWAVSIVAVTMLVVGGLVGWMAIVQMRGDDIPQQAADVIKRIGATSFADPAMLVAGIIVALLGLWLILVAVTPGTRSRVAVGGQSRVPGSTVMPVGDIERRVRIRAQQVDGVEGVNVYATPKVVQVTVTTPVDDTATVRESARLVVQKAIEEIAPVRPLSTRVRVRQS